MLVLRIAIRMANKPTMPSKFQMIMPHTPNISHLSLSFIQGSMVSHPDGVPRNQSWVFSKQITLHMAFDPNLWSNYQHNFILAGIIDIQ